MSIKSKIAVALSAMAGVAGAAGAAQAWTHEQYCDRAAYNYCSDSQGTDFFNPWNQVDVYNSNPGTFGQTPVICVRGVTDAGNQKSGSWCLGGAPAPTHIYGCFATSPEFRAQGWWYGASGTRRLRVFASTTGPNC